jgi:hypothetical protein
MVEQTALLCGAPITCAPLKGTIRRGQRVTIVAYTDCGGRWFQTDDGGWIEEHRLNTDSLAVAYVDLGCGVDVVQEVRSSSLVDWPTASSPPLTASDRPESPTDTPRPIQPTATTAVRGCPGGCTSYPTWCEVIIKGNVSYNSGEKIYHVPGQEYYSDTVINTQYGERWFCTEQEARAAGWRKSRQ